MNDTLDLPDFSKYRYHFRRLWWLPLLLAVLFVFLAGGTSAIGVSQTTSTALLVPTNVQDGGLYTPLTDFETSVEVLKGDDMLEVIESQLGYAPSVTITVDESEVVTIDARGSSVARATQTRDAYVAALREARTQVIVDSIAQAAEDLESEIAGLQAAVAAIDEELLDASPESTAALLTGIDRAQTSAALLEAQHRVTALQALDPSERVDVRVESLSAEEGRAVSTGASDPRDWRCGCRALPGGARRRRHRISGREGADPG